MEDTGEDNLDYDCLPDVDGPYMAEYVDSKVQAGIVSLFKNLFVVDEDTPQILPPFAPTLDR